MDELSIANRQVEIVNTYGLCLRAADKFVKLANRYRSEVLVYYLGTRFNGKNVLDLTSLAAECGSRFDLEAHGPDAEEAVAALAALVAAGFYLPEEVDKRPLP